MENADEEHDQLLDEINFLFSSQVKRDPNLFVKFRICGNSLVDEIMDLNAETATNSLVS
jgi:hypothetical protein